MRKFFILLASVLTTVGCQKMEQPTITPSEGTTVSSSGVASKTTAVPSISTVTSTSYGANNVAPYTYYGSYPGYLVADFDNSVIWTINGSNFGATQGTSYVQIAPLGPITWAVTAKYTPTIVSWTASQIKIRVKAALAAVPITTACIQVVTSSGTGTSGSLNFVPYVNGRQYMQCTWWTVKKTQELFGTYWSPAYASTTTITPNYTPTSNDILIWNGGGVTHQAFIESVAPSTEASGTINVYTITISESNFGSPTFPHSATFVIKIKNVGGVKSYVPGFEKYRAISGIYATQARIQ